MPTLARLSFFVPPAQLDDFAALYDRQLVPLLAPHGLNAGFPDDRPYIAGVFSRLFAVESPAALLRTRQALRLDPAWQQALKGAGERLGAVVRQELCLYSTSAPGGKVVKAGNGQRQGPWHSFSVADGLGSPLVGALLWDPSGKLWVGTWEGLSCFDGAEWINYTQADGLVGARVRALRLDRQGRLWAGTGGFIDGIGWGVSCFDGETWTSYTKADGLAGNWIGGLAEDRQGRLWLASHQGVSCFDGQRFRTYTAKEGLTDDFTWSVLADHQGRIWAGSRSGLARLEGERFERVPLGLEDAKAETVYSMLEDRQGRLWVGVRQRIGYGDGQTFTWLDEERGGLALNEDTQGAIWWSAYAQGVRCWDGAKIRAYGTVEGLSNDQAVPLALDGAGQVWVGTQGGGLCRFEGRRFFTLTEKDGLGDNGLYTLYEDREGRLWVGTYKGVCCWDGKGFSQLTLDSGEDGYRNLALAVHQDRQGVLWFVTFRGDLKRYDGQEVETLRRGDGARSHVHTSRAIVVDPQGRLWCATSDPGLHCWEQGTLRTYTQADGLQEDDVRTVGVDRQGRVWVVFGAGGVSYWDGEQFHIVTTGEGLGYMPGRVVKEDIRGRVWFATDGGGVSCWDGEKFTRYTMAQGLVYDRVFAILEDPQGRMWFGTQGGGVSRFDGQVFQTLSAQDGLVNDVVQELVLTRKGKIWIATEGGISQYTPSVQVPGVRLTQVSGSRPYKPGEPMQVASTQTRVSFAFQGKSLTSRPDRLVYRYRLSDHDPEWRITRETSVDYLYLPLGEYTFEVQAVDTDLNYSEPAAVKLEVVPDPKLEAFKEEASRLGAKGEFVGDSAAVKRVMEELRDVAASDLTVLILGETGTGKGLAAHYVHYKSPRQSGPFITVNCGAIAQGLEESSLFGHEKGAFTGAVYQKIGWVGMAQGGTLFLDEVGELPPSVQVKLLRLLQDHEYERVGGSEVLVSNARIIAATNRDLEAMIQEGAFRQDLYYRLKVFPVRLPPLRERKEDIPQLAEYFVAPVAAHLAKKLQPLPDKVLHLLHGYHWPGNVRELQHVIGRAVTTCKGTQIQVGDIALEGRPKGESGAHSNNGNGRVYLIEEMERRHIQGVLEEAGWKIEGEQGAAVLLGMRPSTLRSRMLKLGIRKG
jgi:DNA-binding NtrC family response regulator/ligand-binding sensor domain-containing protein